jgi:hypothetical protein
MSAVGERSFGKLYPQPLLLFTWVHACVKERVLEHLHGVFLMGWRKGLLRC